MGKKKFLTQRSCILIKTHIYVIVSSLYLLSVSHSGLKRWVQTQLKCWVRSLKNLITQPIEHRIKNKKQCEHTLFSSLFAETYVYYNQILKKLFITIKQGLSLIKKKEFQNFVNCVLCHGFPDSFTMKIKVCLPPILARQIYL